MASIRVSKVRAAALRKRAFNLANHCSIGLRSGLEHRRQGQRQHDWADAEKNILRPHRHQQWVIPPEANAGFVAAMETPRYHAYIVHTFYGSTMRADL